MVTFSSQSRFNGASSRISNIVIILDDQRSIYIVFKYMIMSINLFNKGNDIKMIGFFNIFIGILQYITYHEGRRATQ